MANRPYIKNSIIEIERIFESSKNDINLVKQIYNELQYRKTNRAKDLQKEIEKINFTEKIDDEIINNKIENEGLYHYPKINNKNKLSEEKIQTPYFTSQENPTILKESKRKKRYSFGELQNTHPGIDPLLASWLTLEILTPQPLPNAQELEAIHRKLINLRDIPEPWTDKKFNKRGKETAIYWMIYLGELNLSKAVESILKAFPDDISDERSDVRGNTALAVIVLDSEGKFLQDKVFISSFAWGYGKVREGNFRELAEFTEFEKIIINRIQKILLKQNEENQILPVCASDIKVVSEWLIKELNIPIDEVELSGVAIRVPQFSSYSEAPEPELLNSLFIDDIVRVRSEFCKGNMGQALLSYLGFGDIQMKQDVVCNQTLLAQTLAPNRVPLIRWPSRGRYPLYLMQQAAINHSVKELENVGMVAVNGPPGTGKTTLLRDIIAKVVLDRAIAMAQFEKPEYAFKHVSSMKTGKAFSHLYQLDDTLLGHEIVIASSNNKAVENISREIPSTTAIADDFIPELKYFQTISDTIFAGEKELVNGATWGLAAAVLGNTANRSAFIKSFWWDKQRGMATYLSAIIEGCMLDNEDESCDKPKNVDIPEVVCLENPPKNEIEALERWQIARNDFLCKLKKVEDLRNKTQEIYSAVNNKSEIIENLEKISQKIIASRQELIEVENEYNIAQKNLERAQTKEYRAIEERKTIELLKPNFFVCLFRTKSYKEWNQRMISIISEVKEARTNVHTLETLVEQTESSVNSISASIRKKEDEKSKLEQLLQSTIRIISEGKKKLGDNLADEIFWNLEDEALQVQSPWIYKELQEAKDDLFYSVFALHRAFIDASAKYLRHNIRAAIELMRGRILSDKQESARNSLWASLFLVVPVISTTFASVSRLFGNLGREQLGWLLIDEAGQATPQAALGALWRSKRAIVIGDPLQIEPVVTIPPKLINSIYSQFGVSSDEWAAPDVSAQILADRSSWFGTTFKSDDGELWVGSPLRVHRRCEQPMFSISNYIAYNGLMVYGTQHSNSNIGDVLGKSTWINVKGETTSKWSEHEGKIAVKILKQLLETGIADPDIFFITPFRMVSYKLREIIRNDQWIVDHLSKKVWEWANERIGTIHTFQGKEADSVILVLGAPQDSASGARKWAGSMPNLLNVAVTRAKRCLYIIGDHDAWKNEGYFKYLSSSIKLKSESDWLKGLGKN